MADESPYPLPTGSRLLQDLGFVGFTLEDSTVIMPHKKPRGGELSSDQKAENGVISSYRVRVEHVISSVKRCRVVKDICRIPSRAIRDMIMEIACALHNFGLPFSPWQPVELMP